MISSVQIDSTLLENLRIAYEAHDQLKDAGLLPQVHIVSDLHKLTTPKKKYDQSADSASTQLWRSTSLMALLFHFLGDLESVALRIVLSPKPVAVSAVAPDHQPNEFMVAEAMVSERDTISEIHVPKYIDLDGDRREYIHKLVRYRKASSNRKEVIRELIRHRQFLNDENNGDRLRLDVLSSRMQMSKQAMNSEDVVLSRNTYIAKCAELNKGFLQKGFTIQKQLKQTTLENNQLRMELLSSANQFIEEMIISERFVDARVAIERGDMATAHEQALSYTEALSPEATEEVARREADISSFLRAVTAEARGKFAAASSPRRALSGRYSTTSISTAPAVSSTDSPENQKYCSDGQATREATIPIASGETSMSLQTGPQCPIKSIEIGTDEIVAADPVTQAPDPLCVGEEILMETIDGHDSQPAMGVLELYAAASRKGVHEFEVAVAQSMSRSARLALRQLEGKFVVEDDKVAAQTGASSEWSQADEERNRMLEKTVELVAAREHFEKLRTGLEAEIKDALQRASNSELKQQVEAIDRMQERLRAAKERLKKAQMGIETLKELIA